MLARLARELGKYMWEIEEEMPLEEFDTWVHIFSIEDSEAKEKQRKAQMKQPQQRGFG